MESKIMIDVKPTGAPFIYIDYKQSDDLRDKVLGRFLYESGVLNSEPGLRPQIPVHLTLQIIWQDDETNRLQAMIEIPRVDRSTIQALPKK